MLCLCCVVLCCVCVEGCVVLLCFDLRWCWRWCCVVFLLELYCDGLCCVSLCCAVLYRVLVVVVAVGLDGGVVLCFRELYVWCIVFCCVFCAVVLASHVALCCAVFCSMVFCRAVLCRVVCFFSPCCAVLLCVVM